MQAKLGTLALAAFLLLSLPLASPVHAQLDAAQEPTAGDDTGTETGTETEPPVVTPAPEDRCPHTGVQWQDPRVSSVGVQICNASITITIGVNGIGGSIEWTSATCPDHIIIVPGHYKPVHKVGYKVVNCQPVPWIKVSFRCVSCGFLWLFTCCESSGTQNTANTVTTCEEFPCPVGTVWN